MSQSETLSFREFLQERAAKQQNPLRKQLREEWLASLSRLFDQLIAWVAELDPDHVLEVSRTEFRHWEPSLGEYSVPILELYLGDELIRFYPKARILHGTVDVRGDSRLPAAGYVDIICRLSNRRLYRAFKDGKEGWYAVDDRWKADPLDRDHFEAILRDVLP